MINIVCLTGRITKDLELRQLSGSSKAELTLAVERQYKQLNQPDTDFIRCVAFGKTAGTMAKYLHRGSLVGIEGRIQTRSYTNKAGQKVYVTEVVVSNVTFLDSKQPAEQNQPYQYSQAPSPERPFGNPYSQTQPADDYADLQCYGFVDRDDLPF